VNRPAAAAARDAVFVSYSHDDQDWQRKFTQILAPLVRNRRLGLWDDTLIPAGGGRSMTGCGGPGRHCCW